MGTKATKKNKTGGGTPATKTKGATGAGLGTLESTIRASLKAMVPPLEPAVINCLMAYFRLTPTQLSQWNTGRGTGAGAAKRYATASAKAALAAAA
jgi:hypothetical protein